MGVFDFLKQAGDFISGGSALLNVTFNKKYYLVDEEIKIIVSVQTKSRDFFANKVYIEVKGEEKAKVNIHTGKSSHTETKKFISYKSTELISGGEGFMANQVYEWEYSFKIPSNALPTYMGKNATHRWYVRAGLDVTGKDPSSRWEEFLFFQTLPEAKAEF